MLSYRTVGKFGCSTNSLFSVSKKTTEVVLKYPYSVIRQQTYIRLILLRKCSIVLRRLL